MRRAVTGTLGFAVFVAGATAASAAQWSLDPRVAVSVDRDSNRQLSREPVASEGLSMSTDLRMQRSTEQLALFLNPQFHLQRFTDRRFDRSDDVLVDGGAKYSGERSTV